MASVCFEEGEAKRLNAAVLATNAPTADLIPVLERNGEALRLLREAAAIDSCDFDLHYAQGSFRVLLDHLPPMRNLARLACIRARFRIDEGDWHEAAEDLFAALKTIEHLGHDRVLLSGLVQAANLRLVGTTFVRAFNEECPPPVFIDRLAPAWRRIHLDLTPAIGYERWSAQLCVCEIRRRSPEHSARRLGDEASLCDALKAGRSLNSDARAALSKKMTVPEERIAALRDLADFKRLMLEGRSELDDLLGQGMAAWTGPSDQALDVLTRIGERARAGPLLARMFFPDLANAWVSEKHGNAWCSTARILLALARRHHQGGGLPRELGEIRDLLGGEIPVDPATGDPIGYEAGPAGVNLTASESDRGPGRIVVTGLGRLPAPDAHRGMWAVLAGVLACGVGLVWVWRGLRRTPERWALSSNPMYLKERLGRKWTFWLYLAVGVAIVGGILLATLLVFMDRPEGTHQLWSACHVATCAIALCLTPAIVALSLTEEIQRNTAAELIATPYSREAMLSGKLAARLRPVAATLLGAAAAYVPWVLVRWTTFGMPLRAGDWCAVFVLWAIPSMMFLAALGGSLVASAGRRSSAAAIASAYVGSLVTFFLFLILPVASVGNLLNQGVTRSWTDVALLGVLVTGLFAAGLFCRWALARAAVRIEAAWSPPDSDPGGAPPAGPPHA